MYDYAIIGAGPAGVQLAYFMQESGQSYVVLERGNSPGAFFGKLPRHGKLLSINKRYTGYDDPEINLRWDWNSLLTHGNGVRFTEYSKDYFPETKEYIQYLKDYADRYELNINYNTNVKRVDKRDDRFTIDTDSTHTIEARTVVIATGTFEPFIPSIPGIEVAEDYSSMSIDPENYIDQEVLIIGKGNSGFETANSLVSTTRLVHIVSPNPVKMAWRSRFVGHLRAVNNDFIDTYHLKSQNAVLNAEITNIAREGDRFRVSFDYQYADGERSDFTYDRILLCTGFRFDTRIFDGSCMPSLVINDRFPDQTSAWESANVSGMYFAGALMQVRDFKKKQSAFIHGFRYNVRSLFHHLLQRYQDIPWPSRAVDSNATSLGDEILRRANRSSALWQQTGAICDLLVPDQNGELRYYDDVPTDYAHDTLTSGADHYYTVTLEFGLEKIANARDIMALERPRENDASRAHESPALHPIVRQYRGGEVVGEHHVLEELTSNWNRDVHYQPLYAWLERSLAR